MKKRIINGVLILALIVIFGMLGYLIFDYFNEKNNPNYNVEKVIEKVKKEEKVETQPAKEYVNELPTFREQYNNEYIQARLRIPNIQLDLLVTRTNDNDYFLEHNLYKEYDGIGTAIFDFRNISLLTDKQINIYGHNTENTTIYDKVPFVKLEAYTDENIFNNARDIYLDIDEKEMQYKLIAVKVSGNDNNEHMLIEYSDDEQFINHVNKLLSGSMYIDNNSSISKEDRILIIQTCHYNPRDTYLILIAKEVNE